jgi:toluene methyl-monooxygenase electron transfer component
VTTPQAAPTTTAGRRPSLCRVTIEGTDTGFEVRRDASLLQAALAAGLAYPHRCRVGTCGQCKTRLVGGQIRPLADFGLSPLTNAELKQGYVLACQANVRSDLRIEVQLGHPQGTARSVSARVVAWRRVGADVVDVRLGLDEPLRFRAGQYATIAPSGSFVRRSYSFYDPPPAADLAGADEVGFLVKRLPGGQLSEWLWAADRRGAKLWLDGPYGQLGDRDDDRDAVCIAGGTGIAPILSIVEDRLNRCAASFIVVLGVRRAVDLHAIDRLWGLRDRAGERLRVVPILSDEPASSPWRGLRGLVTEALTAELCSDYRSRAAFVCGGTAMVDAVERRLRDLGVPAAQLHSDRFLPAGR